MDNMATNDTGPWAVYRQETLPRSAGRVLLADLLTTYTLLQYGIGNEQIADSFEGDPEERHDTASIISAVRLLGSLLLNGTFRSYARPIGGGELLPLDPSVWEVDDFLPRFATCAIDPRRPFDSSAEPTHRIFVDHEAIQAIFDACCEELAPQTRARGPAITREVEEANPGLDLTPEDRLIRMPELKGLVGMSRTTIYDRIRERRFPEPVRNGSRIAAWRAGDVREWLANPR